MHSLGLNLGIDHSNVLHQVNNTGRVAVFVIVPGNELDELRVQHDTSIGIEDGRSDVTLEVSGDKGFIAVSEEGLHVAIGLALDVSADLLVGGGLFESARQVNNGNINSGDTECHTGDLANKIGDDLGDGLGGTSRRRNDVARGSTSSTPVLSGRRVNNGLGGGHGVNSGHESLLNTIFVVDGLDQRGKSIGSARSTGDEVLRAVVNLLVDTHDDGHGVILGGGRVNDLLGSTIDDGLGRLLGEENTSGLTDVVSTESTPADLLGVTAARSLDLVSVKDEEVTVDLNSLLGLSVDGVVLVLVGHVVRGGRTGVDAVELDVIVFHHDTGYETADTSESVNTGASDHGHGGIVGDTLEGSSREPVGYVTRRVEFKLNRLKIMIKVFLSMPSVVDVQSN
jgi:hypothetical protein